MTTTVEAARRLVRSDRRLDELPGAGRTPLRLRALFDIARSYELSTARLVEAHTDAVAILAEADRTPEPGCLYGVWASQHHSDGVVRDSTSSTISGSMAFATGIGHVERALLTASSPVGTVLIDVELDWADSVVGNTSTWTSPALRDSHTGSVTFQDHRVRASNVIGEPGWYLDRVGFWHGACAPAACWAGGAAGIIDAAAELVDDDPHRKAHVGALESHLWTLTAILDAAGRQIDADPDSRDAAELIARSLRHAVVSTARDVLDRFGRAFGPRPHVDATAVGQRCLDLDLYIKQHHAERELPQIARVARRRREA